MKAWFFEMGKIRPTPEEVVNIAERRKKAFALRKAGLTLREIGEQCGVTLETARLDIKAVLDETRADTLADVDAVRQLELERLDTWLATVSAKIAKGDLSAIHVALKIQERRARLLGLDAPAKSDVTSGGEPLTNVTLVWGDAPPKDKAD